MHAVLSSGKPTRKFNYSTQKDVNEYFNNIWKLIHSALHKKNIQPYGFRVVEPHHDGTPHWHLLFFIHPNDVNTAHSIFSKYTLKEDGKERGIKACRFKAVSIDPKKGGVANSGDWAAYVMAMGGAILPRRNRLNKLNETVDMETSEVVQTNLTRYGDIKHASIIGLIYKNIINKTKTRVCKKIIQPMTACGSKYESDNKSLVELYPIPI